MTRRLWVLVTASVVAVAAAASASACALDDDRTAAGPPPARSLVLPTPVLAERTATAQVPPGFEPLSIEFADGENGFALFTRCGTSDCEARLLSTRDGGRSWTPRTHPRPRAKNQQMYVGVDRTVVLLAEPNAWYVSRDGAASWQRRPYDARGAMPPEYFSYNGQFYLDCPTDRPGGCPIRDWRVGTGWSQPLPAELDHSTSLTDGRDGRWWLTGLDNGRVTTAVSEVAVRGFRPVAVPPQPSGQIFRAWVASSADGKDHWLIAEHESASTVGGTTAGGQGGGRWAARRAALKSTGLPLIWQYEDSAGGSWVPRPITGIQARPNAPYSVAPAGDGLLALAGPDVSGYLDRGAYVPAPGGPSLDWVGQLPDGTLRGGTNDPSVTYLGSGSGLRHGWIKVVLAAP